MAADTRPFPSDPPDNSDDTYLCSSSPTWQAGFRMTSGVCPGVFGADSGARLCNLVRAQTVTNRLIVLAAKSRKAAASDFVLLVEISRLLAVLK